MALSDAKVRNAKVGPKNYKIADGEGLFLLVHTNGGKYWRMKYVFAGREKTLSLGVYPDVGLGDARDKRAAARKALAAGIDPGVAKKEAKRETVLKAANSFETVAREWLEKQKGRWSDVTQTIHLNRLTAHAFPTLGSRPIADLKASEVLTMLRGIETRQTLETAHRVKQDCSKIFNYAIATTRAEHNPVPTLEGALAVPVTQHHKYLKEDGLPDFFQRLEAGDLDDLTKLALRLIVLTFVRSIELRGAKWSEFDLGKAAQWVIPAERMKMKEAHIVPLASQAVAILHELKELTGDGAYVFPNQHNPESFMSDNTLIYALYRLGYRSRITVHGFRSTASTILNENGFMPDVIERQLAHSERNEVRAAYNHAQYLPERRKMMQWWADYLDKVAGKKKATWRSRS